MLVAAYNGSRCEEDEDDCAKNDCYNSGTCKDLHLGFECLCRTTDVYTGKRFVSLLFVDMSICVALLSFTLEGRNSISWIQFCLIG